MFSNKGNDKGNDNDKNRATVTDLEYEKDNARIYFIYKVNKTSIMVMAVTTVAVLLIPTPATIITAAIREACYKF